MLYKSEEKKIWVSQKPLSEGYINGYHLLKKSGWSDQYLHFWSQEVKNLQKMCGRIYLHSPRQGEKNTPGYFDL